VQCMGGLEGGDKFFLPLNHTPHKNRVIAAFHRELRRRADGVWGCIAHHDPHFFVFRVFTAAAQIAVRNQVEALGVEKIAGGVKNPISGLVLLHPGQIIDYPVVHYSIAH